MIFGSLIKMKIRRKLQTVCLGRRKGSRSNQAAIGGTYSRNFASLNDELLIASTYYLYIIIKSLFLMLEGFFTGDVSNKY